MTTVEKVLECLELHRGSWFSGARLASELDVSRNAVWKAVNTLREKGYPIAASTKRGYSLSPESDLLSREGMLPYLKGAKAAGFSPEDIHVYDTIDSTNRQALRLLTSGAPHGTTVIASSQTGGRGHGSHTFSSPAGGIYFSSVLYPDRMGQKAQADITAAIAGCVCRVIGRCSGKAAVYDSPASCLISGKKVCGILTEAGFDADLKTPLWYITGIGINFTTRQRDLPEEIRESAGSVFREGEKPAVSRNEFCAMLLSEILSI